MKDILSSRERLLLAINHKEPDHVPLYFKWWGRPFLADKSQGWTNQFERVNRVLRLGLDDTVGFDVPRPTANAVRVRAWKANPAREQWPLLFKEYDTPKGTLRQIVRQTSDWPHGSDIPIFSDFLVPSSRSLEYLVKDSNDLDALSCLFRDLDEGEVAAFHHQANKIREFAEGRQVLVECGWWPEAGRDSGIFVGDALPCLCGLENVIRKAFTDPGFIERLLDIVLEWDNRYLDALLDVGFVDVILHGGWYENVDFWSPKLYRRYLAPRIRQLIEKTHRAGVKFCYVMTAKQTPLLEMMKGMGVDMLYGPDPVQGASDLALTKRIAANKICLWGGVNSAITLGSWSTEEIRHAVEQAISTLAPEGGFILSAIDQLFEHTPWESIQVMIDTWKSMAN